MSSVITTKPPSPGIQTSQSISPLMNLAGKYSAAILQDDSILKSPSKLHYAEILEKNFSTPQSKSKLINKLTNKPIHTVLPQSATKDAELVKKHAKEIFKKYTQNSNPSPIKCDDASSILLSHNGIIVHRSREDGRTTKRRLSIHEFNDSATHSKGLALFPNGGDDAIARPGNDHIQHLEIHGKLTTPKKAKPNPASMIPRNLQLKQTKNSK